MSFHTDLEKWLARSDPAQCPVCRQLPMPEGMVDIVELPSSWLTAEPVECLRGACHLTAKIHVLELYELDDSELLALMRDVQVCARALKSVTGAVKINYEIHGNTLPHLHVHLYPRYMDDPFPGKSIDYNQKERQYSDDEFEEFVGDMRKAISEYCRKEVSFR
jgi:diadenosine tetraphosphate (Ap4A) HIT family hydrolase